MQNCPPRNLQPLKRLRRVKVLHLARALLTPAPPAAAAAAARRVERGDRPRARGRERRKALHRGPCLKGLQLRALGGGKPVGRGLRFAPQ